MIKDGAGRYSASWSLVWTHSQLVRIWTAIHLLFASYVADYCSSTSIWPVMKDFHCYFHWLRQYYFRSSPVFHRRWHGSCVSFCWLLFDISYYSHFLSFPFLFFFFLDAQSWKSGDMISIRREAGTRDTDLQRIKKCCSNQRCSIDID